MECEKGCKLNDNVVCGECKKKNVNSECRLLYWVDGDAKYAICKNCNKIEKLSEDLVCEECGAKSKCKVKWKEGYKP